MSRTGLLDPGANRRRGPLLAAALLGLVWLPTSLRAEATHRQLREAVRRPVVVVAEGQPRAVWAWSSTGTRSFLGVQTVDLTPELRRHFGVAEDAGILVAKVIDGSPAATGGLRVGDIVMSLDGEPIESPSDLSHEVGDREIGETVRLEVWRDGSVESIEAVLAEHEGPWVDVRQFRIPELDKLEGLQFSWSTEGLEHALELDTETFQEAIERLEKQLESPEWRDKLLRFQQHQGDLMRRIDELEGRLRELEGELQRLPRRE